MLMNFNLYIILISKILLWLHFLLILLFFNENKILEVKFYMFKNYNYNLFLVKYYDI